MKFHKLDFLSQSPKNFIFQKSSNQTNLGGLFCLLYIIIIILIALSYIIPYYNNDKYSIEYSLFLNYSPLDESINMDKDPKLNPTKEFIFDLYTSLGKNLSEKFKIFDMYEFLNYQKLIYISRNTIIKKKISELFLGIIYQCNNSNCTKDSEDETDSLYSINILFDGFRFDFQNRSNPLIKSKFLYGFPFYFNKTGFEIVTWEVIKYKQINKGIDILLEQKEEIFGHINSHFEIIADIDNNIKDYLGESFRILGFVKMNNPHDKYIEYKRTRVDELDLIAGICSLCLTILNFLRTFFTYYSQNFDNYKIIENILKSNNISMKRNEFNNSNNSDLTIPKVTDNQNNNNKNLELIKLNNLTPLIDEYNIDNKQNEQNKSINDDYYNNDTNLGVEIDQNRITKNSQNLPKGKFYDFFINNINCCCKNNEQNIINTCNEIISKYYSIDAIIYNQIKLENLFKDYKWNNASLNNIENNNLIIKLKTFL